MKIDRIRFKNLNSLTGEWQIDFTHPAYENEGLFAIVGPTGAGKSTILDALSLALYGATPRLGKITRSNNEIMARHRGDSFAEVTFTTRHGTWSAHWSQHRARRKSGGELQQPSHELSEVASGKLLAESLRSSAAKVEELTGMDYKRFTRSMLLAQGGFAAFLQADSDERAPMLEQITGTALYSRISIKVHEIHRAAAGQLAQLESALKALQLLSAEEKAVLQERLLKGAQQSSQLALTLAALRRSEAWFREVDELQATLGQITIAQTQQAAQEQEFAPLRIRLQAADAATGLEGEHATLTGLRTRQHDTKAEAAELSRQRCELQTTIATLTETAAAAETTQRTIQEQLSTAIPLWQRVRELDTRLASLNNEVAVADASHRRSLAAVANKREELVAAEATLKSLETTIARLAAEQQQHSVDQWLESNLSGVAAQLNELQRSIDNLAIRESEFNKRQREHDKKKHNHTGRTAGLKRLVAAAETAAAKVSELNGAIAARLDGRLLREYRAEEVHLKREAELQRQIASYEEVRRTLAADQPCPLCGATSHPYVDDTPVAPDELQRQVQALRQRIEAVEELTEELQLAREEAEKAASMLQQGESGIAIAAAALELERTQLAGHEAELAHIRAELLARRSSLAAELQPLAVATELYNDLPALHQHLKERLAAWLERSAQQTRLQQQITACNNSITTAETVLQSLQQHAAESLARLQQQEKEVELLRQQRHKLFGNVAVDDVESKLQQTLVQAVARVKEFTGRLQGERSRAETLSIRHGELHQQEATLEQEVTAACQRFTAGCKLAGFDDEAQYRSARLAPGERQRLRERQQRLERNNHELKARRVDREERLAQLQAQPPPEESAAKVGEELALAEAQLNEVRDELAAFKLKLDTDRQQRTQFEQQQEQLLRQRSEVERWAALHLLIGSADGKKYRNFAQGLTFEVMVNFANRQLAQMNDRYLLQRDADAPLELNVIDNYQAGAVRSTKNLSGGESFIVSLALALGLSQMASQRVAIDSLFLDEGFGTLDEESLETALETLATLRNSGKTIGIISHVPALRDRIATQIKVIPGNGGCSRLEGPGVTCKPD